MVEKTRIGGVHVHVSSVAEGLRKVGHEVDVVTRVEDLGLPSFVSSYSAMIRFFRKVSGDYDVVHAHDWSIAYPAIRAGIRNLVATFHGLPTHPIASFFQERTISYLDDRAVIISPKMLKQYPHATYIPNGVDIGSFRCNVRGDRNERRNLILGVAQRYSRERIVDVARKSDFDVVVAESIPYGEMPGFYASLDVFVSIPPRTTGFNMVWLEAMACEVPYIIGTNVGIGEILPIYKVNNFDELENLLVVIREGMIPPLKGSREWIIENGFTWSEHARRLCALYERVM